MDPSPPVDVEAEARRVLENLHVELAFADLVRMAVTDGAAVVPESTARAPRTDAPLGVLRAAAVLAALAGTVLTVVGFVTHPVIGLLGLFLLPAVVLLVVLAVEQVTVRLRA